MPAALAWTAAVAVLAGVAHRDAFFSRPAWGPDGHSALSLHLAIADAYCDRRGHVSRQYDIAANIANRRALIRSPFPDILRAAAGSVDAYCRSVVDPVLNNENSLMLTMAAAMNVNSELSPGGLSRTFGAIRLILLTIFGYAILISGGSVAAAALAILICGDVLGGLEHFQYTVYPFVAPMLLGLAGFYVVLVRHGRGSGWVFWGVCVGAGFLTAFFANIRSSHLPIYSAFFLIYATVASGRRSSARILWRVGRSVAAFGAGYLLFTFLLIRPLVPAGPHTNYAYHTVAHPLVLGLAMPPSDLSRREGIVWNDEAGLALARRMIPDAIYLGDSYERALFAYYWDLWKRYPWEMIALYAAKFETAGEGMVDAGRADDERARTAGVLAAINLPATGTWLMAFFLAAFLAAGIVLRRRGALLGLLFSLLSLAAIGVLAEAAIIIPTFRLMYHAYLLIFTGLLVVAVAQITIDYASALVQKHTRAHPGVAANH